MTDDSFRTTNAYSLVYSYSCNASFAAFSHFIVSLLRLFFVAVSTLLIQVCGEISFYFRTPLLFARARHVIPFELPLWQAT